MELYNVPLPIDREAREEEARRLEEFRKTAKSIIDYIIEYRKTLISRDVTTDQEPFYLQKLLPAEAPHEPENWDDIMTDYDSQVMPGVTHWYHPYFFAYFPAGTSYPSVLGEMLTSAMATLVFNWYSSPAATELESITLNWFGKALGLPSQFLYSGSKQGGGGCINGSASECIFLSILAARYQMLKFLRKSDEEDLQTDVKNLSKLVAYVSKEAHSSVEKGIKLAHTRVHLIDVDEYNSVGGEALQQAIREDRDKGLIPYYMCATLGTTGPCSFDNLMQISAVVRQYPKVWLHVDGAYAGSSFVCPEFRYLCEGIEYADSFNVNPNKWFRATFDCSCVWFRDFHKWSQGLVVNDMYLGTPYQDETVSFRDCGVALSRRQRALKLWFIFRSYGVKGMQRYIRNHCNLAKRFESHLKKDKRFEITNQVLMGLVCFRILKLNVSTMLAPDTLTEFLLAYINRSRHMHMVPTKIHGNYTIRFCVNYEFATPEQIDHAWQCILDAMTQIEGHFEHPATPPRQRSSRDRAKQLAVFRHYSHTVSVPQEEYKKLMSSPSLDDNHIGYIVPESDDSIIDKYDISALLNTDEINYNW